MPEVLASFGATPSLQLPAEGLTSKCHWSYTESAPLMHRFCLGPAFFLGAPPVNLSQPRCMGGTLCGTDLSLTSQRRRP